MIHNHAMVMQLLKERRSWLSDQLTSKCSKSIKDTVPNTLITFLNVVCMTTAKHRLQDKFFNFFYFFYFLHLLAKHCFTLFMKQSHAQIHTHTHTHTHTYSHTHTHTDTLAHTGTHTQWHGSKCRGIFSNSPSLWPLRREPLLRRSPQSATGGIVSVAALFYPAQIFH